MELSGSGSAVSPHELRQRVKMRLNGFLAHRFKFVIDDHPTIPNVQVVTHTVKASEVRRYSYRHSEPWHRMEVGGKLQAPTA